MDVFEVATHEPGVAPSNVKARPPNVDLGYAAAGRCTVESGRSTATWTYVLPDASANSECRCSHTTLVNLCVGATKKTGITLSW